MHGLCWEQEGGSWCERYFDSHNFHYFTGSLLAPAFALKKSLAT